MPKTKTIHSSGRFDRSRKSLVRSIRRLIDFRGVTILTGTETSGRSNAFLRLGTRRAERWNWAHPTPGDRAYDHRGDAECWAAWDSRVWKPAGKVQTPQLTDEVYYRYHGPAAPLTQCLLVPLRHRKTGRKVIVVVIHMPLSNTANRAAIWLDCASGLRRLVRKRRANHDRRGKDVSFLINADWNKNARDVRGFGFIQTEVAHPLGMKQAWEGNIPKRGGTHGPLSLLDGTVTDLEVSNARLVADDGSSDHRPYVAKVRVSKPR